MIGRNELCPCGSGKKYKKCCLQKNQSIEFTRNKILYAKGLYKNMENKIYEYSKASSLEEHREKCIKKFYISQESNLKIDKLYNTYLIYDYRNDNGNIIINPSFILFHMPNSSIYYFYITFYNSILNNIFLEVRLLSFHTF